MYQDVEMGMPRQRGRGGSVMVSFFVSVLTTLALFFGLREAERRGLLSTEPSAVEVPEVVGMNVDQAREVLAGRGLLLSLQAKRTDARVAAGGVAQQTPLPGSQARTGSTVSAVVSAGPVTVPDLTGLPVAEATMAIEKAGLKLAGERSVPHATLAAQRVIETDPLAGSGLGEGGGIILVVSSGPADKTVPTLVGLKLPRAREAIVQAGFTVGGTRWGYSDYKDGNVVLKQTPEAGQAAEPGSKIDLVVNEPDQ